MTCIVAIVEPNGAIHMGADSAASNSNHEIRTRKDPKIYKVGEFLFGFTGSFRMGQILGYKFSAPEHRPDYSIEKYMHTSFIDHVRELFHNNGYAKTDSGRESGGFFLVGYRGRLFGVESDYQIEELTVPYMAIGSGSEVALGSLFSTTDIKCPLKRLELALKAAEAFNYSVRSPFIYASSLQK